MNAGKCSIGNWKDQKYWFRVSHISDCETVARQQFKLLALLAAIYHPFVRTTHEVYSKLLLCPKVSAYEAVALSDAAAAAAGAVGRPVCLAAAGLPQNFKQQLEVGVLCQKGF